MALSWTTSLLLIAASATGLTTARCEPIEGLDPILRPGQILVLGEIHGTREAPGFASRVACLAVEKGLAASVGLELPREEEPRLLELIRSEGDPEIVFRFLSAPSWSRRYQDGRTSKAMLQLIEDLGVMRRSGRRLDVHFLDHPPAGRQRDMMMAERLLGLRDQAPERFFLVLAGNLHARQAAGSGRMAALIAEGAGAEWTVSLDMAHSGGTAWICQGSRPSDCGPARLRGRSVLTGARIEMIDEKDRDGFHGLYHVGPINASPPAREPGE